MPQCIDEILRREKDRLVPLMLEGHRTVHALRNVLYMDDIEDEQSFASTEIDLERKRTGRAPTKAWSLQDFAK